MISRRNFAILGLSGAAVGALAGRSVMDASADTKVFEVTRTDEEWQRVLTKEQYYVLRKHGTERAGTSPLDREKRKGTFVCAACYFPLFDSKTKYDSGTGWPSFFDAIKGAIGTSTDFKLILPRTEYHCARCGGHQGHVFGDGPPPTGQRYCNNGVAVEFVPEGEPLPKLRE